MESFYIEPCGPAPEGFTKHFLKIPSNVESEWVIFYDPIYDELCIITVIPLAVVSPDYAFTITPQEWEFIDWL